jgi:putative ATP-dependent endonuclease of the OLD family
MAKIRFVEICNFRSIKSLRWLPSEGINCLVGPGDSGKSTLLDAIDLCLTPRRNVQFSDTDFHLLDVENPISISVTIGALNDGLKNLDTYGLFLKGFDAKTGTVEEEPEAGGETVLTINLTVASDLEPIWTLVSERAAAQGVTRNLSFGDRAAITPTRIGSYAENNLSWRRGSILNRLTDERADASAALVKAARDARAGFGDQAGAQLGETLKLVSATAAELGIPVGATVKALLDAHSASFSGGTIALHNEAGVPLRALGLGSARLLVAGLQRRAEGQSSILLIDELEHGLEPHRIIRLLHSIGAKEKTPPMQAFVTTHSPVVLRELSGTQISVLRSGVASHSIQCAGDDDGIQSTLRLYPDAFLSITVLVCEGASEVGLMRGLDQYRCSVGMSSIMAAGASLVDAAGVSKIYRRVEAFGALGYRVAVLRDDDVQPNAADEDMFEVLGGSVFKWRAGRTLEDELFASLSASAIQKLLAKAVELHDADRVEAHLATASGGTLSLAQCQTAFTDAMRPAIAAAAQFKKAGWFKSVSWMEEVARDIVGPDLATADPAYFKILDDLFKHLENKGA